MLDIEGTTTPVDFVYKTLFPYARREVAGYLARNSGSLREEIAWLSEEFEQDGEPVDWPGKPDAAGAQGYLLWLMDRDRKSRALKAIQGKIWEEGYRSGSLQGEVYPDVLPAIQRWKAAGSSVYIYSSGSVLAQRLLFGSLPTGDLTKVLDGFFDTEVGGKREPESYRTIASHIAAGPALFLSDILEEVEAARHAGWDAIQILRDGKQPETEPNAPDFSGI